MPGYFLVFCFVVLSGFYYLTNKTIAKSFLQWRVLIASIVTFLVILPICIPYYIVSQKYNYVRPITDAIHFAIQLEDLLTTDSNSQMNHFLTFFLKSPNYPSYAEIQPAFPGVIFSALVLLTIWYFFKQKKRLLYCFPLLERLY